MGVDVLFGFQGMTFEWDDEKAINNLEKHGVSFDEAAQSFLDPFHGGGDASAFGEGRQFLIGYSLSERLLLVIYVERGSRIRVISARPATSQERKQYEDS